MSENTAPQVLAGLAKASHRSVLSFCHCVSRNLHDNAFALGFERARVLIGCMPGKPTAQVVHHHDEPIHCSLASDSLDGCVRYHTTGCVHSG